MQPTALDIMTDAARAERLEQLRALADNHAALAREFRALHEQARAVYRQDGMSHAERRAQIDTLVRAEGEVLDQARCVMELLQGLLGEQVWHTRESQEPQEPQEPRERSPLGRPSTSPRARRPARRR